MVMICVYVVHPLTSFRLPLSQTSTLMRCIPPGNLHAVCLGIFGDPLCGLDVHQIEEGFLYLLCERRGFWKRQSSCLYQRPAQSLSRHPHPLVTEQSADPVNYRRVPQREQWFIQSVTSFTTTAFRCTHINSTFQTDFISKTSGDLHKDTRLTFCMLFDHKVNQYAS